MVFSLDDAKLRDRAYAEPWRLNPDGYWGGMNDATREFSAPLVAIQLDALTHNAHDLLRRAGGLPIRVASKSIRVREVLETVLRLPGYRGVLAYSLAEAVWLSATIDDVLVAYPTVDRAAIAALAADERAASRVTVMIDSVEQLDLIDSVVPPAGRQSIRVCLDFDSSWRHRVLGNVGVFRSPVHESEELRSLAETVVARPGFMLVAVMSYEAQIAGVQNAPKGNPLMGTAMRVIQAKSADELRERRARAIGLVREIAELEFVNGGGTGSVERTVSEPAITEVAAGSGLYGPHIFDHYQHFTPAPAVGYALDVVRKATPETATVFAGGWIASGVAGPDRLPQPVWPRGLSFAGREGAGEVQTPLLGANAATLGVGDRVWMRHAKSGEVMEHVAQVALVSQDEKVGEVPTYRGEGKVFS